MLKRLVSLLFPPPPMNPLQAMQKLFARHGVDVKGDNGWLSSDGGHPKLAAYIAHLTEQRNGVRTQLDVEVAVNDNLTIVESFADTASSSHDAINAAYFNFSSSSLHVLLSAVWNIPQGEQVVLESWECTRNKWEAHVGPCVRKNSTGDPDVDPPRELYTALEGLTAEAALDSRIHWIRVYFANIDKNKTITEVLLDNEPWVQAESRIKSLAWPALDRFYSARMFIILKPLEKIETQNA